MRPPLTLRLLIIWLIIVLALIFFNSCSPEKDLWAEYRVMTLVEIKSHPRWINGAFATRLVQVWSDKQGLSVTAEARDEELGYPLGTKIIMLVR